MFKRIARDRHAVSLMAASAVLVLSGCAASKLDQPIAGYTCCNLWANQGWISSDNQQHGVLVPAGEPIRLESIKKRFYLYGAVGALDVGLRDDSARTQTDTLRWARRVVVPEDPRLQLAQWPAKVKTAVAVGRVFAGMTREQVTMAIGYPSPNNTADLASPNWRYLAPDDLHVELQFAPDGTLLALVGTTANVQRLQLPE